MKKIIPYILAVAFLSGLVYLGIKEYKESLRTSEIASERINTLNIENEHLKKLNDSLFDKAVLADLLMEENERLADSIGKIADSPGLPCEHELALREQEVEYVRAALDKCKESKAIQTQRVGLAEIRVENQVELCGEMMVISKQDIKAEKRKSFFRGMGTGGLIVGILIILAL